MNRLTILILAIFLAINVYSQNGLTQENKKTEIRGVSASTALFILKQQEEKFRSSINSDQELREQYGIKRIQNDDYINAFIVTNSVEDLEESYGFRASSKDTEILTGLIPINNLHEMSLDNNISYIDIGMTAVHNLDKAHISSNVVQAHNGTDGLTKSYTGAGVVVGIIDSGFDYTHPTFYSTTTNELRIKRVWEQRSEVGTAPAPFSYGREIIGDQIIAAKYDIKEGSHGTHVAGIAAGSGRLSNDLYKGVAYESDIILVATTMQVVDVADGIKYIFDYASSVGKACVINLSLGLHVGPHDGNSAFDKLCDQVVDKGKILVGAAGNDKETNLHINKQFSNEDRKLASFLKFNKMTIAEFTGSGYIDIWGEVGDEFKARIVAYENNKVVDSTDYISFDDPSEVKEFKWGDIFSGDKCKVELLASINPLNNKPNILALIDRSMAQNKNNAAVLEIIANNNANIHIWGFGAFFSSENAGYPFVDGDNTHTCIEIGGTGNHMISVGAYTSKINFVNSAGDNKDIGNNTLEDIANFSSMGPTADNRFKPEITAPGNVIVSSVNSFDEQYKNNGGNVLAVTENNKKWHYSIMQGTSMAAPMVAGIIALFLEENPNLNHQQILDILKTSAKRDNYTGTITDQGSNIWGWGKIDALAGLLKVKSSYPHDPNEDPTNIFDDKISEDDIQIYPNPTSSLINIKSKSLITGIEITNLEGQKIITIQSINSDNFVTNTDNISNGIYFIKVILQDSIEIRKITINK